MDEPNKAIGWNSRGGEIETTGAVNFMEQADNTLLHVVMHGAYHRGQIAAAIRAAGGEPAYTDFIHCIRQGFVA